MRRRPGLPAIMLAACRAWTSGTPAEASPVAGPPAGNGDLTITMVTGDRVTVHTQGGVLSVRRTQRQRPYRRNPASARSLGSSPSTAARCSCRQGSPRRTVSRSSRPPRATWALRNGRSSAPGTAGSSTTATPTCASWHPPPAAPPESARRAATAIPAARATSAQRGRCRTMTPCGPAARSPGSR